MTMNHGNGIYRLQCAAQNYDWGKLGKESQVAAFIAANDPQVHVDLEKPYAELWMGTHPNGPCFIEKEGQRIPLKDWISSNPQQKLGESVAKKFSGDLPFLFKVLSIRKALSIQAHPDKPLAQQLHSKFPHIYKDPNHKPEMALAITDFEALCGFRPLPEIRTFLQKYPEFSNLIEKSVLEKFMDETLSNNNNLDSLKALFGSFCRASESLVKENLGKLLERTKSTDAFTMESLLHRLDSQFPGDIGCFCIFLLNYVKLKPGEAIFLGANEPHAYLSGDCVECMAASDNVVRAGLTPKLRDVETLISMLTYKHGSAESQILKGKKKSLLSLEYDPPIEEFSVLYCHLEMGEREVFAAVNGPSIAIITKGKGIVSEGSVGNVEAGTVLFIEANNPFTLTANSPLTIYVAFCY